MAMNGLWVVKRATSRYEVLIKNHHGGSFSSLPPIVRLQERPCLTPVNILPPTQCYDAVGTLQAVSPVVLMAKPSCKWFLFHCNATDVWLPVEMTEHPSLVDSSKHFVLFPCYMWHEKQTDVTMCKKSTPHRLLVPATVLGLVIDLPSQNGVGHPSSTKPWKFRDDL